MPLFGKRLTPTQEIEVQSFVDSVNMVVTDWYRAHDQSFPGVIDLLRTCDITRRNGGELKTVDVDLLSKTRGALQEYLVSLTSFESLLQTFATKDWYPKNIAKAYANISETSISLSLSYIRDALQTLEEPDPLSRKLGNDKVNVFVETVGYVYQVLVPGIHPIVWKR